MYSSQQLPPGWRVGYTSDGKVYYLDDNTKSTHWHLPQQFYQPQTTPFFNAYAPPKPIVESSQNDESKRNPKLTIQPKTVQFKKPAPFVISTTPRLTINSNSQTISNNLKDTFEIIDDFIQQPPKPSSTPIRKDMEVVLSSNKKIKPMVNLTNLFDNNININYQLPIPQINKSFNFPLVRPAVCHNNCPCGNEFGYFKHQKQQCKCCKRYFCNDCLSNQKCILCNYHQDGKCLGSLLTYCESSDYKDANIGLQTLFTANSVNTFPPRVVLKSGIIPAVLSALKHDFCCLSVLNLIVAFRQRMIIQFTDKELNHFGRLGSTSDDPRIVELCLYLILSFVTDKIPLPPSLFELISLPRITSSRLFQPHIIRLALAQFQSHREITIAILAAMEKQDIPLSSIMLYDLIQLLPNPMILDLLTFCSFNPTHRPLLLNGNILTSLIPTAESLQIVINLIDPSYNSFFEGHMELIAHLLIDDHALTAELSTKCVTFLSSPQKEEFIEALNNVGAVPLLLRSVIAEKIGLGLNIVAENKMEECMDLLLAISENNEVREQWLIAMKMLGGIKKDMGQCINIVVNCVKQRESLKSALELMMESESIIEMIKKTDENLIALLQTEYRGEAAKVIQKAFKLGEKNILISKGLLSGVAQSIENECNAEVLKLVPNFVGEMQSAVLLQRIIHKIAGTYLLQTQFTQISLETLVLLCEDSMVLPLLHSVQINKMNDFMQFLALRINTANPTIKISYLKLFNCYIISGYCKEIKQYSIANIIFQIYVSTDDYLILTECIKCLTKLISLPQTCGSILYRQLEQKLMTLLFAIYSLSNPIQQTLFGECINLILTITTLHPSHLPLILPMIQLIPFKRIPTPAKSNCLTLLLQLTTIDPTVSALIYPALENLSRSSTQILAKLISISSSIVPLEDLHHYFTDSVLIDFLKTGDIDLVTRSLEIIPFHKISNSIVRSLFKLLTTTLPSETKIATFNLLQQVLPNILIADLLQSLHKILPLLIKLHGSDLLPIFSVIMTACPKEFSEMIIRTNLKDCLIQNNYLPQFISLALTLEPIHLLPYFLPLLHSLITSTPIFVKTVHSALKTLLSNSEGVVDDNGLVVSLAQLLCNEHLLENGSDHFKVLLKHQSFVREYLKNGVNFLIQFYVQDVLKQEIIEAIKTNCCIESLPLLPYILEDSVKGNKSALCAVNEFMKKGIGRDVVTSKNKEFLLLGLSNYDALISISLMGDIELDQSVLNELIKKRNELSNEQIIYFIRILVKQMVFGFEIEIELVSSLLENRNEEVLAETLSLILLNPFKYSICLRQFPMNDYKMGSLQPFINYLQPFIL